MIPAVIPAVSTSDPWPDALRVPRCSEVESRGIFGDRLRLGRERLLLKKDEDALLAGFERRPGSHPWIGEHAGKWLDAACSEAERVRAWAPAGSRDAELGDSLTAKIERVVARLCATQEADGYLGTYARPARWTEWDVWVHKYVLIGLLAHCRAFGDDANHGSSAAKSLEAARRIGELLIATFRHGPLDLMSARVSTHRGMAAGSVLVALVPLYRATGEERFLEFARFVAGRLEDEASGPGIAASLRRGRGVHETANAKAYELLSCLCGLVDLARATGEAGFADAAKLAFADIVEHQLYVTGGLSFEEHFRAPGTAPSVGDVSETCALVTWMQLCKELFALTGERRHLAPFERAASNHLLAAQREDGSAFCYFTPLEGPRRTREGLHCCGSSGPRGLSLVPQLAFAVREPDRVEVHLLIEARARLAVAGGRVDVAITAIATTAAPAESAKPCDFPRHWKISARSDVACELVVHAPGWARRARLQSRSHRMEVAADESFRARLEPSIDQEVFVEVLDLVAPFEPGRGREAGRRARIDGPLVLAKQDSAAEDAPFAPFHSWPRDPIGAPLRVWQEVPA